MESVTSTDSWERFRTVSHQKVASQLTIPELKQLSLFSSDMQEMFVLLLCNDLSSLFYFIIFFYHLSFFLSGSCGLSLNAAQLDGSRAGGDRWQSCLIRNTESESSDSWAETQQRGEDMENRQNLKPALCDWKAAKVGSALFMMLV